jgi:hypothetical protein
LIRKFFQGQPADFCAAEGNISPLLIMTPCKILFELEKKVKLQKQKAGASDITAVLSPNERADAADVTTRRREER